MSLRDCMPSKAMCDAAAYATSIAADELRRVRPQSARGHRWSRAGRHDGQVPAWKTRAPGTFEAGVYGR
jgi:hypothetical protein